MDGDGNNQPQPAQPNLQDLAARVQQLDALIAARRGNLRLTKFENKEGESWIVWKKHFLTTSALNGYTDREKRLALAAAMHGKAALATLSIDVEAQINGANPTINQILDSYQAKFRPPAASQIAQANFDRARQGKTESLLDYHGRLHALYKEAYPEVNDEHHAIRRFMAGLRERHVQAQVLRNNPATYQAALEAALNEHSVQQMGKYHHFGSNPTDQEEPMDINAIQRRNNGSNYGNTTGGAANNNNNGKKKSDKCHYCKKKGHWKSECLLLKKHQKEAANKTGVQRKNALAAIQAVLNGTEEGEAEEDAYSDGEEPEGTQDF